MEDILAELDSEKEALLLQKGQEFMACMGQYRCAMMEIETKLNVLNVEFSLQHDRNPIESIKSRIKTPRSIVEKLKRKGFNVTVESMEENLMDVAGIRVICSFREDIYSMARMLASQADVVVLERKDYIQHPKPNGYQSLHLIVQIPIFLSDGPRYMKVEVQFRTIAMDFWASLDHKLRYKKEHPKQEEVARRLLACAQDITRLDLEMENILQLIEENPS